MSEMVEFNPKAGNDCFGCGLDNEKGLKLSFKYDPEREEAVGIYTPPAYLSGGANILHGGVICLLLDEVSSKVLSGKQWRGLTRNIDVDFLQPVPVGREITLKAKLVSQEGRKINIEAEILNAENKTLASAKALFISLERL